MCADIDVRMEFDVAFKPKLWRELAPFSRLSATLASSRPLHGTLPLAGQQLPKDLFFGVVSFLPAFDLLALSQCSKASLHAATFPAVVSPLLHNQNARSFMRSLLVLTFLSRQSEALFLALVAAVGRTQLSVGGDKTKGRFLLRHTFLYYWQLARLSDKYPNVPALYALADCWKMSHTLVAAWCNDVVALRKLASERKLEPNVRRNWPHPYRAITPLCRATEPDCLRLLLQHGADVHANVGPCDSSEPFPVIHEAALRASPQALNVLLQAGADKDVNMFVHLQSRVQRGTALHFPLALTPVQFLTLSTCPERTLLRRSIAESWHQATTTLLSAGADAALNATIAVDINTRNGKQADFKVNCALAKDVLPSTYIMVAWPALSAEMGNQALITQFRQLLDALKSEQNYKELLLHETTVFDGLLMQQPRHFGADPRPLRQLLRGPSCYERVVEFFTS